MKRFTGVTGIAIVLFIATTASAAQQRTPNDPIHLGDEQQRTPNDPIRLGDEQQEITLDKIVVTPLRYAQQISKIASSLTVITQQEVIQSHASGIVGLLREKTNLMIQDWYGNTAKANVGSRGFGENDGMNTLVLIDGRRTNAVDLSGVDWTQIPLHQVERIEIIQGGNSVMYGDKAVSGVINIITRKGSGPPRLETGVQYGSYDLNTQRVGVSGSYNRLSYFFSASREGTHGYRNNTFVRSRDFSSKLEYEMFDDLLLRLHAGYHRASFGLPGGVSATDIETFGRRYARYGDDRANTKDYYCLMGFEKGFGVWGELTVDTSFRRKGDLSNLIGGNGGWNPIRKSIIETLDITSKYELKKHFLFMKNKAIAGADFYRNDYSSDNFDTANMLQNTSDINKYSLSGYFQNEFTAWDNLIFNAGFRYESVKYEFDFHDNSGFYADINSNIFPHQRAFNGGLAFNYWGDSTVFLNINQSYRFPAVDEYFTGTLNTDLNPQTSRNYELGIRHWFTTETNIACSLYRMKINNELYTNPIGGGGFGATENYDTTMHEGLETSATIGVATSLELFATYSLTHAYFDGGLYDSKIIPMVPLHKGNLGLRFTPFKYCSINIRENYNGERYRINDHANALPQLKGYFTTDVSVAFDHQGLRAIFGINNIFNKAYSEFATYGVLSGNQLYYPSPRRNFNLKIEYAF